jgi:hypothetical protein
VNNSNNSSQTTYSSGTSVSFSSIPAISGQRKASYRVSYRVILYP